jgi:hypothetical protein
MTDFLTEFGVLLALPVGYAVFWVVYVEFKKMRKYLK